MQEFKLIYIIYNDFRLCYDLEDFLPLPCVSSNYDTWYINALRLVIATFVFNFWQQTFVLWPMVLPVSSTLHFERRPLFFLSFFQVTVCIPFLGSDNADYLTRPTTALYPAPLLRASAHRVDNGMTTL